MDKFIGILEGKQVLTRQMEKGVFEEATRCNCPYMIEQNLHLNETLLESGFCAGILGFFSRPAEIEMLQGCRFPRLNVSNTFGALEGMGNVRSDDPAVGRLAAENLLGMGHRYFLAVGQSDRVFSSERLLGFTETLRAADVNVSQVEVSGSLPNTRWTPNHYIEDMWEQLGPHIEALPSRSAIFAVSDWIAWPILRLLEQKLPERQYTTALLGVDNLHDSVYDPRKTAGLSSIVPGFRKAGARGLHHLLHHIHDPQSLARIHERIPPEGVAERASTAGTACDDPLTARMFRLLWSSVRNQEPVDLADLARRHGMSLRTLENKFNTHFGRSARESLCNLRIDYGKNLLRETTLSVAEIAARCGYADTAAFSNAFRRLTHTTPRGWRNDFPRT